ncbi:amino acid adenylation domain-containing protein [Microbulbifer sp. ANSA003]|uniref:amino acid adenylation domain-containing protein n=1 Tax=Microbulbifer sp. ANSA003 TaxID=3243360 RepID=UPI0040429736
MMNSKSNLLDQKRRALLQKLTQQKGITLGAQSEIVKRTQDQDIPLSFAQQRLWFLAQLNPQGTEYNLHMAVKMKGEFCHRSFESAWQELIEQNPVLRVVMKERDGIPYQQVKQLEELPLQFHDLADLSAERRESELERLRLLGPGTPFDLGRAPLFRIRLIKLADTQHVFTLTIHHIITDGQSLDLLVNQFSHFYLAHAEQQEQKVDAPKVDYLDFCFWQRGEAFAKKLDVLDKYWLERLANLAPLNTIPGDFVRPAVRQGQGKHYRIELDADLTCKLRDLAKRNETTMFILMQAAWSSLLSLYTRNDDIVLGSPVSGRTRGEFDGVPGFFANTLVFRHRICPEDSFAAILVQHKKTVVAGLQHQDMPFDRLVDKLALQRDLSYTPLFQLSFAMQRGELLDQSLGKLQISDFSSKEAGSQFDLSLQVNDVSRYLACEWQYDTALFKPETIIRLGQLYVRLLSCVAAQPDCAIGKLSLLNEQQRHELLAAVPAPTPQNTAQTCLHELFEASVARDPEKLAVVCGEESLSYEQLNRRANQLARYLQNQGVKPDTLVGLSVERSLTMVVGILAILKAGGAYVPLDPGYPASRLEYMIADSEVGLVLTQQSVQASVSALHDKTVSLDAPEMQALLADLPAENLAAADLGLKADHLAYVIYTSGSTGKPKGALVQHDNVVRLMTTAREHFDFSAADTWSLFHSYAFDFSVWELWGALAFGGSLVVVPYQVSRSPADFYRLLKQHKVSVLNQTPSAFYQLVQEDSQQEGDGLALRYVIFGGEALSFAQLAPWVEKHGDAAPELINMYGITETTVHVTYRKILREEIEARQGASLIGKPLSDLGIVLLNESGQLVPDGLVGEMYVCGGGVCRGYLNLPELTADRFAKLEHFGTSRFYRTGDLARRQPDGEYAYLGRADQQVKIKGFRIELGEVEHAVRGCHGVQEAVVTVRDNHVGDKYLVGYLVAESGTGDLSGEAVKAELAARLPEFMIPSAWVILQALPLTANGKVDFKALPAPDMNTALAEYVAPSTPSQKILCDIWQQLLDVDQVGMLDNFFALGGDSILSLRAVSLAQKAGLNLTTQALYQAANLEELSHKLSAQQKVVVDELQAPFAMVSPQIRAKLPESVTDAYPVTALQLGMVFHNQLSGSKETYHNVYALRLGLEADIDLLRQAVACVIAEHEVLRTEFNFELSETPLQLVHESAQAEIFWVDLTRDPDVDATIEKWHAEEGQNAVSWQQAPLFKLVLFKLSEDDCMLGYSGHHAMLDGWSLYEMLQQVVLNYQQLLQGKNISSRRFMLRFADYVAAERKAAADPAQGEFWRNYLADAPFSQLPRALSRDKNAPYHTVQLHLQRELMAPLIELAQKQGVTMKTMLFTAHLSVMGFVSGQDETLTGLVCNGRIEHEDAAQVLGLYLNSIPWRQSFSAQDNWLTCLAKVAGQEAELLPYSRFPLAELVKHNNKRELFEVLFNYISMPGICAEAGTKDALNAFGTVNYPLLCNAVFDPLNQMATINLSYDGSELNEEQIRRYAGYYERALTAMLKESTTQVSCSSLLAEPEKQGLYEAHHSRADWNYQACLHEDVFKLASEYDSKTAVICGEQQLSYGALKKRATQLAARIQQAGIAANQLVAIDCRDGIAQVIAMLASSLSGAAYLPVDPDWPLARKQKVVELGEVKLVLCDDSAQCRQYTGAQHQLLDLSAEEIWQLDAPEVQTLATPEDLAYVIFTSGSTGEPKGVMLKHCAVQNTLNDMVARFGLSDSDTVLGLSSIAFDLSVFDVFASLQHGMTLVLPQAGQRRNPEYWGDLVQRHRVTVWNSVPAIFQLWVDYEKSADNVASYPGLRRAFLSGDWLPLHLAADAESIAGNVEVHSLGGATEAAIWSITYPIAGLDPSWHSIPYGKAMANQAFYVFNPQLQLCPVWTEGDLYIGGVGLAEGYWRDQQKTAAQFIKHPQTGERLYRTGDRGRFLPDGNIEFLGRSDFQVQINGYRVELGEIESELNKQAGVKSSLLAVHQDQQQRPHLIAYVLADETVPAAIDGWQSALALTLPHYMLPKQILVVSQWPLTDNGKVDRKALPMPEFLEQEQEKQHIAPANEVEQKLYAILQRLLGIKALCVTDNVFMLGMDSIVAIQLVAQAKREGLALTIQQVYQFTSVRQLAQVAGTMQHREAAQNFTSASLLPVQHWFLQRFGDSAHHFNQAFAFSCEPLDIQALETSVTALLQAHPMLSACLRDKQIAVDKIAEVGEVVQYHRLSQEQSMAELVESVAHTLQRGFNLQSSPLIKIAYLEGGGEYRLLLVCHHLIIDGVSWRILLADLEFAYQVAQTEKAVEIPPAETSFAQWSDFVRQSPAALAEQENTQFWLGQHTATGLLAPENEQSFDCRDNTYGNSRLASRTLTAELTGRLLGQANEKFNTDIQDLLVSGLALALSRVSGQTAYSIMMESYGRDNSDLDTSRTIGWFTELYPVRLDVDAGELANTLIATKENLRKCGSMSRSYGQVKYLSGEEQAASLQASAEPQLMFNYLGQLDKVIDETSVFQAAPESLGADCDESLQRPNLLEVTAMVIEQKVQLSCRYNPVCHPAELIQGLLDHYQQVLGQLVDMCLSQQRHFTPSDVPEAGMELEEINDFLGELFD